MATVDEIRTAWEKFQEAEGDPGIPIDISDVLTNLLKNSMPNIDLASIKLMVKQMVADAKSAMYKQVNAVIGMIKIGVSKFKEVLSQLKDMVKSLASKVAQLPANIASWIASIGANPYTSSALVTIRGMIKATVDGLLSICETILSMISNAIKSLCDIISGAIQIEVELPDAIVTGLETITAVKKSTLTVYNQLKVITL